MSLVFFFSIRFLTIPCPMIYMHTCNIKPVSGLFIPLSTIPRQNVVWYNNSWLGFLKISELCTPKKRKIFCKNWALICYSYMLRWLIGNILGKIICKSSNWQHILRLKIPILRANWQLFRLERIAKCPYFILSTQNIKFHWFVMKIKKFLLPIWWYNRGSVPLGNKYFGVFVLWMGQWFSQFVMLSHKNRN